jgi:hypothetical protein
MKAVATGITFCTFLLLCTVSTAQEAEVAEPPSALERARQECKTGEDCPHLPELIRLLWSQKEGAQAAAFLGELGDVRAVAPLALVAVYGPDEPIRQAAADALAILVKEPKPRSALLQLSKSSPDPAVARQVKAVLPVEAPPVEVAKPEKKPKPPEVKKPAFLQPGKPQKPIVGRDKKAVVKEDWLEDPEATRVIWGLTALGREPGEGSWNIFNLGVWDFDYGVNENLQIGITTMVPIVFFAAVPHVKFNVPINDNVNFAINTTAGGLICYIGSCDLFVAVYGGGPILSIGTPKMLFNLNFPILGVTTNDDTDWLAIPSIGFAAQLSRRVKINLELYCPIAGFMDNGIGKGEFWLLLYGIRIFGEKIYGDISFALPIFEHMGDILEYTPFGFPLLGFGFQW